MQDEEACSIDKKLKQAKRNSIINSSLNALKIQGLIKDAYELQADRNSSTLIGGPQQDLSPYSKNDVSQNSGRTSNSKRKKDPFLNRFQKIHTEKTLSHWLKQEKDLNSSKQLNIKNNNNLSISQNSLNLSNNEETKQPPLPESTQLPTPNDKSVVSVKQSDPSLKTQQTSSLLQRRAQMKGLSPVITKNPMQEQQKSSLNQSQKLVKKGTTVKDEKYGGSTVLSNNSNNDKSPISPSLTKFKQDQSRHKRRETIKKFQDAVWKVYRQAKSGEDIHLDDQNLQTAKSLNTQTEFQFHGKAYLEPSTPLLRAKMTFFDVVSKLNPFQARRKRTNALDDLEESKSNNNNSQRVDTQRELQEKQRLEEIQRQKKARARQLWRKAKAVLRAINIWKSIQNEIQLYGTHNYEFRRNFKLTSEANRIKKAQSLRKLNTEEMAARRRCNLYIHPDSLFKQCWQVLIIILLLYVGILMPFSLAFLQEDENFWYYLDIFADFVFLADVVVNSFMAFEDEDGILITNNKEIFMDYLKSWFAIDFISSIPFNFIEDLASNDTQVRKGYFFMMRLLKIPRIHRLMKFNKLLKAVQKAAKNSCLFKIYEFLQINQGRMRLLIFIATAFICVHVASCFWYLSAKIDSFEPDTWIIRNNFQDVGSQKQYLASVYWAVATVLTVGYGDIHAQTVQERIIAIFWMMIGVAFYAFTIGILTSVLAKMDTRESILNIKIENIEEFCGEANISHELKKKIRDALEYHSQRNAFLNIQKYNIFNELPGNLKYEIAIQIHDGAIGKLPFFYNKDDAFVANIVPLLQPLKVISGEYIYMQDDHPYDIFFIVAGRVNFLLEVGECVFKTWPAGSYFGEIEIILHKKRICTAKAEMQCDLFTLNKKYYSTIIYNDYPEIERQLRDLAQERELRISQTQEKANLVLETIGLQKALLLPMRNRGRRISQGSMNSSKRKTLNSYQKLSAQMKITQSFDVATRSIHSRGESNIDQYPAHPSINEEEKAKDKEDENSSTSGEYNIWGEKVQSSDEESKKSNSFHTDTEHQSEKKSPTKSTKSDQQFQRFASFFNTQRALKEKTNSSPFSPQKYLSGTNRDEIIQEEDRGETESERQSDSSSSVSSSLQHAKSQQSNVFRINVIEEKGENLEQSQCYNLNNSQSIKQPKSPQLKSPVARSPQAKLFLSPQNPSGLDLIGHDGNGHFTPISAKNSSLQQISFSELIMAVNSRQQSEQKQQTLQQQQQNQQLIHQSPLKLTDQHTLQTAADQQKVQDFIPRIKINDVTVQKGVHIINNRKFTEDSYQDTQRFCQLSGKRTTSNFAVNLQAQISSPKRGNSSSNLLASTAQNNKSSPIRHQMSFKSFAPNKVQSLTIKSSICKLEIIKVNQGLTKHEEAHYQKQIHKLNQNVTELQEKFENSYNEQIFLEDKCVGLQQQITLLGQLLKNYVEKQNVDELQPQNQPKSKRQQRKEQFQSKKKKIRVTQSKEAIEFHSNHASPEVVEGQQFLFNSRQDYNTYGQSIDSNAPLMKQQTFTLNSENSLVPVSRLERRKPSSTTVEDKKKDNLKGIQKFSFTDDLELLQQEERDQQIQSVYSSIDFET